nr:ribonuclease domain-containing protein [Actinocrinis puniceicyclus]
MPTAVRRTLTVPMAAALLAALTATTAACADPAGAAPARGHAGTGVACSTASTPPPGIPVLTVAQLPSQALTTLRLIAAGGPYPYAQDDSVYGNYSRALPRERYGYYHEFTVLTPGSGTRGARRVITGSDGEDYYTADHYSSFDWIACTG